MYRLICIAALVLTVAAGCGNPIASPPESSAGSPSANIGKGSAGAHLNALDYQETIYNIFDNYRVVVFWQKIGNTWYYRVEIYRNVDGAYIEGSGWDTFGTTQTGRDERIRDQFDDNNNGVPDGGEIGGGIDNQG